MTEATKTITAKSKAMDREGRRVCIGYAARGGHVVCGAIYARGPIRNLGFNEFSSWHWIGIFGMRSGGRFWEVKGMAGFSTIRPRLWQGIRRLYRHVEKLEAARRGFSLAS